MLPPSIEYSTLKNTLEVASAPEFNVIVGVWVSSEEQLPRLVVTLTQEMVSFEPTSVHVLPPSIEYLCSLPVPVAMSSNLKVVSAAPAEIDVPEEPPVMLVLK